MNDGFIVSSISFPSASFAFSSSASEREQQPVKSGRRNNEMCSVFFKEDPRKVSARKMTRSERGEKECAKMMAKKKSNLLCKKMRRFIRMLF